jgi:hypothetical protein
VAVSKVPPLSAAGQLAGLLDSPEIAALVSELEATRWTGRPGYPIRSMVGMALAKSLYAIPTWTKTVALVPEHVALRLAITKWGEDVPSVYACYRFAAKLRAYHGILDACLDRVTAALHGQHPEMGHDVAIDGSDMPAYANGQRYLSKRRGRLQAPRDEVALPDRRVLPRVTVDQGRPAAPAHPARVGAVAEALPLARRGRARVRAAEARMGAATPACPWVGAGATARRPDDPRQARLRAQPGARHAARFLR